ncbi:hypothetical protein LEP1GSC079_3610 [Leptospira interrogans str. FPW1039]|uniref:Uncharacterized protein n=2 Tax=Leptospira interrogans TaxID=173 RepID=A0A0E2D283_LEPIR|nr:hypothetical protein LEP1GSC045_1572 [Leptospira interrogans serovar Pomona str. Kennewicki LC82-25]EKN99381.1 hypothetical protein LEP1GSC014_0473 [Leptospira interrogans serovar Pomona str. Pomona]EKR35515.1 hypothetical protein LEP1GSC096_3356 [Leptospira interrogans serovar Hebdomadis str. R499]EKR53961.1 hypothetical protein LEP1GSC105_1113 [Leptospira interrogans str. UI 12758]EMF35172.1 hypothetical protein LEP1GSC201_1251 [Leptospira interrogans serovar Pomona str. Fox 32256]EMI6796
MRVLTFKSICKVQIPTFFKIMGSLLRTHVKLNSKKYKMKGEYLVTL